jgi:hypothetical protein
MSIRKTKIVIIENETDNNKSAPFEDLGDFMLSKDKKHVIINKSHTINFFDNSLTKCDTELMLVKINLYPVENVYIINQTIDRIEHIINLLSLTVEKITIKIESSKIMYSCLCSEESCTHAHSHLIKLYNLPTNLKSLVIKINNIFSLNNNPKETNDFMNFLNMFKQKTLSNAKIPFNCDFRVEPSY